MDRKVIELKRNIILMVSIYFIITVVNISNAVSATIYGKSCSLQDVQTAIDLAENGDTVNVPEGLCTWTSDVIIPDSKKITLLGQGFSKTILTSSGPGVTLVSMGTSGSRITGIGFKMSGSTNLIEVGGKGWRIDNCKFETPSADSGAYAVNAIGNSLTESPAGCIDNNTFIDARILAAGLSTFSEQMKIWAEDAGFGTDDAIYVEDNYLVRTVSGNVIDGNRGGKYVYRFNSGHNAEVMAHAVQSSTNRSLRMWEIYHNTFHSTGEFWIVPIFQRGGEGIMFNNTITGTWSGGNEPLIDSRRSYDPVPHICDGTRDMDGKTDGEQGWLCRDQPGAGKDSALSTISGSYPNYIINWASQTRSPHYFWGNTNSVKLNKTTDTHVKINRDYYEEVSPFDGKSGVGVGTLSQRPSTCTPGVGYWATDKGDWNKSGSGGQGVLYKCTSTDNWELYYTPFEYPHPLRKENNVSGSPEPEALIPPKILKIELI